MEIHLAGGTRHQKNGCWVIEDDHSPTLLPETWTLFTTLVPQLPYLKAVVLECERNPLSECIPTMQKVFDFLKNNSDLCSKDKKN